MRISDWISDVCSSDLLAHQQGLVGAAKNDVREGAADIDANSYAGRCCGHRRPLMSAPIPRRPMAATTRSKACVIMPSPLVGRGAAVEPRQGMRFPSRRPPWRCGTAFRSEEQTSELQSLMRISYAVFCLKTNTY